jgi:hypothetical protein
MKSWWKSLSAARKVVLFVAGGMVTLVFDALVAHMKWNLLTMRWTQAIPIVYGLLASAALFVAALAPLARPTFVRLVTVFGLLGMAVGGTGVVLHGLEVVEQVEESDKTVKAVGNTLKDAPPAFAPASFAGIGLLLVALPRITRQD